MWTLLILMRGIAVGCLLLGCLRLLIQFRGKRIGVTLLLFFLGLIGYLLAPIAEGLPLLEQVAVVFAITVPPSAWWVCRLLFDDSAVEIKSIEISAASLIGSYLVIAISAYLLGENTNPSLLYPLLFFLAAGLRLGFLALSLVPVVREWRNDLVETRRRIRLLVVLTSLAYMLIVVTVELFLKGSLPAIQLELGHSMLLVLLIIPSSLCFLLTPVQFLTPTSRPEIDGSVTSNSKGSDTASESVGLDHSEKRCLEELRHLMEEERIYRDHGLTIGGLATRLKVREHILRRLINRHLGYRNFNAYLNRFRLDEAARRLSDLEQERLPILTIALEVGFASINPFNRGFRARFETTPREYRASQMKSGTAESSPEE